MQHQRLIFLVDGRNNILHPTRKLDMVKRWLRQMNAKVIRFVGKIMVVQVFKTLSQQRDNPIYWIGVDPGDTIGICLVRITMYNKVKQLLSIEFHTRSKEIKQLLEIRRGYRNMRRYFRRKRIKRKGLVPKHRPARFENRRRLDGRLTPSVRHFLESHKAAIQKIVEYVPDANISLEYAKFDIQRMMNSDIEGEQYQHGRLFGYQNIRAYVLHRDKYACQLCGKKNVQFQLHHVVPRSQNGKDHPDNLITLCPDCHVKVHTDAQLLKRVQSKIKTKIADFTSTSRLNIIMPFLKDWLSDAFGKEHVWFCIGADSYVIRRELNLVKSHCNDAYCIAINKLMRNNVEIKHEPFIDKHVVRFEQKRQHNRRMKNSERNRLYYVIKNKKCIRVATNRNGNPESFHNVYSTKILPLLKQGYQVKVNPGVKGYRKKFSEVGFKEGATIEIDNHIDVLKGYSLTGGFGYTYDGTRFKLKDMNVVYPYGGWKCVET
ncbi:RRXRR domain-containing protein [bacterium]|nr:RRXRR domain-containing protein [bacterium]